MEWFTAGIHNQLRVGRCLVGRGNAGEVLDDPLAGLLIKTFHVALLAHLDGCIAEDLQKFIRVDQIAHQLPIRFERRDERGKYDDAGFQKQFGDVPDAANVLRAVMIGKSEIAAQTVAHVIAIQHEGAAAQFVQLIFHGMRQRGLARAGQAGEPEDYTLVVVLGLAMFAGDGGVVPDGVAASIVWQVVFGHQIVLIMVVGMKSDLHGFGATG